MSTETRQRFGRKVRELREERSFSMRGFALTIDINKSYMLDIEHGRKSPTLDTIEKIARGLGVTISFLTKGIDSDGVVEYDSHDQKQPRQVEPLSETDR